MDLCFEKIDELKTLELTDDFRNSLSTFYTNHLADLEPRIKLEADVHNLTIQTFTFCASEFKRTFLDLIMKPQKGKFHYEMIIDVLNYIATKLIPGLEEIRTVSNFPISVRKKKFTKDGDKILIYIEQFIDVLEKWQILGNAYLKLLED